MATNTTFVDGVTPIATDWLNFVNIKAQERFNVKNAAYGAKGDGVTNDTAAIALALTAASAIGGVVYFPAGTYLISSALTLPSSVYVCGDGPFASIIKTTSTTADTFTTAGTWCGIRDIGFDTSATKSAGSFINITGGEFISLDNLFINKAFTGITCAGTAVSMTWINIRDTVATTGIGISITGGNDQFLERVLMDTSLGTQPFAGLLIRATGGAWAMRCDFIRCGTGVLVQPLAGQEVDWLFFTDTSADTCSNNGMALDANTATSTIKGVNFRGCWTSSCTNQGFFTTGNASGTIDGVYISDHRSFTNGLNGMLFNKGTNIKVTTPEVGGNSQTVSGVSHGINFGVNVSGWSVVGGRVGPQSNQADSHAYNIWTDTGCNQFTILGVDVRGGVSGQILINSTATTKVVKSNVGYNPIASTSITVTASPFSFTNNTGETVSVITTGGTVSAIKLNSITVATATGAVVAVPHNQTVQVTYTVAPTMTYLGH